MASNRSLNLAYLALAAIAVVAIFGIAFVLLPQYNSYIGTRATLEEARVSLAEKQRVLTNLDQRSAALVKHRSEEELLRSLLPDSSSVNDMIRIIGRNGDIAAVIVGDIRFVSSTQRAPEVGGNISSQAATFSVKGSYPQVRQFTELLERSPRLVNLLKMGVSSDPNDLASVTAEFNVKFYTYGS